MVKRQKEIVFNHEADAPFFRRVLWLDPSPFEVVDLDDGGVGCDGYGLVGERAFQLSE